jgi:hypothetical protein
MDTFSDFPKSSRPERSWSLPQRVDAIADCRLPIADF